MTTSFAARSASVATIGPRPKLIRPAPGFVGAGKNLDQPDAPEQLALRLLGKEAVAVDHELQVVKVSTRGIEKHHPKNHDLREATGCSVVAIERGDALLVEFGADFAFAANDAVYICGSSSAVQRFYQAYPQK